MKIETMTDLLKEKLKRQQDHNNEIIDNLILNQKRMRLIQEYIEWGESYNYIECPKNTMISKDHWDKIVKEIKEIK